MGYEYNGVKFEDRNNFIEANMGLVKNACRKYSRTLERLSGVEFDDLISLGSIGLVKAYNKFNPELGFKFSTYAVYKIEGEIKKFIRDHSVGLKFTRREKEDYYKIAKNGLLDKEPKIIAEILEIKVERVERALEYGMYAWADSLSKVIHEGDSDSITLEEKCGSYQDFDSNLMIEEFTNTLGEREEVIFRLYMQELSQEEIGKKIGISQVSVSRNLMKIKDKVKKYWGYSDMAKCKGDKDKAIKLAKESNLGANEIASITAISYPTAYRYIQKYRLTDEDKKKAENIKNSKQSNENPVTIRKMTEEEVKKYGVDLNNTKVDIKPVKKEETINIEPLNQNVKGNVFLQLPDTNIDSIEENITQVAKSLKLLGFKNVQITISGNLGNLDKTA